MNVAAPLPRFGTEGGLFVNLRRSFRIWQRHRDVFFRLWKTEVGGIVAEPMLILLAVGFGLGSYIESVGGRSYREFLAPGLFASYAMFGAVFETTYGTYMRMETHRTFHGILQTPIGVRELVQGEIMWAATRSLIHVTALLVIASAIGLIGSPYALLALPAAVLAGVMFGSIAMLVTSVVPSISGLNNFFTMFITPMFFFSGVFFPLDRLPETIQTVAWFLPLTSVAYLMRSLAFGEFDWSSLGALGIILAFISVFLPLSIKGMRRRLVK